MSLVEFSESPVVLRLNRNLVRLIKRGHPWVFADALQELPSARAGSPAILLDHSKGQPIARGFYDPGCPVALRICETDPEIKLDDRWVERRLRAAVSLRRSFSATGLTTGFRLVNGEGDGLPGLVIDAYGTTAVFKRDGDGPTGFWNADEIAHWLARELGTSHERGPDTDLENLRETALAQTVAPQSRSEEMRREWMLIAEAFSGFDCAYERPKERGAAGRSLLGTVPDRPVEFLENGLRFTADVVRGQKTGFFLDQRDNRQLIRTWSRDRRVLNVFSYTGGFSVAAGIGGAAHVTSVDSASAAISTANDHWTLNNLAEGKHLGIVADAFDFLSHSAGNRQKWDVVILDPPSFAPNRESVPKAMSAYQNVIEAGARVTAMHGVLAVASCSSHVDLPMFLECCEEGISKARRRGTVVTIAGQPADHPTPLALPEFRYLKFVLIRLD